MAPKKKDKKKDEDDTPTRIAVVSPELCKPKKCKQECKKFCPVVKVGKLCVEVTPASKISFISEELCIGCGICVKKCPFDAIQIINLPSNLANQTTHRYGPNSFKLHRLPMPRPGQVRAVSQCLFTFPQRPCLDSRTSPVPVATSVLSPWCPTTTRPPVQQAGCSRSSSGRLGVLACAPLVVTLCTLVLKTKADDHHRHLIRNDCLGRTVISKPGTNDAPCTQVLGLVGTNGIGKSTALKILSGKTKPNLGRFENIPDWETILAYFRGSELQNYFKRIIEDDLKASLKPQYVDSIPRAVRGSVKDVRPPPARPSHLQVVSAGCRRTCTPLRPVLPIRFAPEWQPAATTRLCRWNRLQHGGQALVVRRVHSRLTTKGYDPKHPIRTSFGQRFNRYSQLSPSIRAPTRNNNIQLACRSSSGGTTAAAWMT